ncbi:MAG TPA: hypothetical protein VHE34_06435 [Puia sp.]|uniref:hypothetical protein n=1 Tax=Puia sp. TaxID=2045100 RepID=UPI002CC42830|nr:hypothetical protein [Puia sp.]HVU94842.1 hypothetical protein [Puia sp.]
MNDPKRPRRNYGFLILDKLITHEHIVEEPHSLTLFELAAECRRKQKMTKTQLREFCRWKSVRSAHWALENTNKDITEAFVHCLAIRNPRLKLHVLTALKGVNIPTASAILMFLNRKRYGVIDTRVWQLLYDFHLMDHNPNGVNFNLDDWDQYLSILRHYAKKHKQPVRDIELQLFLRHRDAFPILRS